MRAKLPHTTGKIDQQGLSIHYEIYGCGEHSILFIPPWTLINSRCYKGQIPYFSEHFTCITFDPRGNGKSDKSENPMNYRLTDYVNDVIAIMDKTNTQKATIVGYSLSGWVATAVAAYHPERVEALISLDAFSFIAQPAPHMVADQDIVREEYKGWDKWNRNHWRKNLPDFAEFFIRNIFVEPHSTKQIEDSIGWATGTTGEVLAATTLGLQADKNDLVMDLNAYQQIQCPALIIHGEKDIPAQVHHAEAIAAAIADAQLLIMPGAGHAPLGRFPAKINLIVRDFLATKLGSFKPENMNPNKQNTDPKVLFLSSPIGLGHARRDLAIAQELRKLCPQIKVEWLSQDPVTRFLEANEEFIHPASKKLANESTHIESEAGEHDLHAFHALRNMDEILVNNFMVFQEVVEAEKYALVVADEAWDVDHFWHEHPELKKNQVAWLTDFVGFVPMPGCDAEEIFLTSDYNAEMISHVEGTPTLRDRAIFVGNRADIIPHSFGTELPQMQDWIPEHFDFCGYVLGQHPEYFGSKEEQRQALGYAEDEKVCIVTVGGSGVGAALVQKILQAYPKAKSAIPELRLIVITGPRLNSNNFKVPEGVETHEFVLDLDRHLSACDLAVVQGGLTTCMELAAANTPFLYFPLKNHFEQNFHVAHRLEQYSAGRRMIFDQVTPEHIADAMIKEIRTTADYKPVESDGAECAAKMLAELL